ncbi:MAG: hypothetical protein AAF547_19520 [Actinomycetota bacterium]
MFDLRPSRLHRPRGNNHRWWSVAAALLFLSTACSGERPTFIEGSATTTTAVPETTAVAPVDEPPPAREECQTISGPGPLQVVIASVESSNPCVALANHHRLEFVNESGNPIDIVVGATTLAVGAGATVVSEPVGALLPVGYSRVASTSQAIIGVWLVDVTQNLLDGERMGLSALGPVAVGQTPVEISAALDGIPIATTADACYVTDLEGDPYSPLLTVRDGTVAAIRVHTPGQLTRSDVGVGTTEADIVAAYGERIETVASPDGDPDRKLMVFVPVDEADRAFRLVFEVEGGQVISMRNGLADQVIDSPDCG